ncbi:MAG: IS1 family transposase [Synechococcaceae cyanobacterium SM2_3_2]|nr:IS1 family transposase [Synechococcaceae cyanobacterium SM2_3_2]
MGSKSNKKWLWIAMDKETQLVVAAYVGNRDKRSAQMLWDRIPDIVISI